MFTGIVTDLGRVRAVERRGDTRFSFETAYDTGAIALGASIACSGVCLTVVDKGPGWFAADASAETLATTTMTDWGPGTPVNLERALKLGDELGGHLMSGHVDGVAEALERREEGDSLRLAFAAPAALLRCIAPKGSVALDGVSLTVNQVHDESGAESGTESGTESGAESGGGRFEVNIIAHTARATTLGACRPGMRVNLEIDVLARYVQRLLSKE
ncbi:MAG: riboflavin synthase [Proteobacteria bacterium]|nr:riboflavin synthase [Pseudomonadota bacterium]